MLQGREPVEPPMFMRGAQPQPQATQPGLDPQAIMTLIQRLRPQPQVGGTGMQSQNGGLGNLIAAKGQQRPAQQSGGMFTGGVAP